MEVSEEIALEIKMIMGGCNYARTPEDDKMGCDEARSKRALMKIMGARWEQLPNSPHQTQNLMFKLKFAGFLYQHRPVGGKNHRWVSLG